MMNDKDAQELKAAAAMKAAVDLALAKAAAEHAAHITSLQDQLKKKVSAASSLERSPIAPADDKRDKKKLKNKKDGTLPPSFPTLKESNEQGSTGLLPPPYQVLFHSFFSSFAPQLSSFY